MEKYKNRDDLLTEGLNGLEPHVREKALEIVASLKATDIPEGSTKIAESVRRAIEWFTNLEG